jgi:transposase-like protein
MMERGLTIDFTTIYHWVQPYTPEQKKRCWPSLKTTNDYWHVDETTIKINKTWM